MFRNECAFGEYYASLGRLINHLSYHTSYPSLLTAQQTGVVLGLCSSRCVDLKRVSGRKTI